MNTETLVTLPCYEPAGQRLELTESDLRQHLLVIGSTGCGKTTLLWNIIEQLVPHGLGLLVLDAKCDGLDQQLAALARRCGSERDLVRLGPEGSHALDLFGRLRSYDDVELVTQLLLLAAEPMRSENAYWQSAVTALLASALTLLHTPGQPMPGFLQTMEFLRRWFFQPVEGSGLPPAVTEVVTRARRAARRAGAAPQLDLALDQVEVWKKLDPRTRSNLQSCLMNVLRPLLSSVAGRCFAVGQRPRFGVGQVATEAKLCVVSVNVLTHPGLAGFVLWLARRDFFNAVQARGPGEQKLCGLVADEFALIADREDVDQLATLRSKRGFVLAATQGLASLDERLGERMRRAVLLNFNSLAFMRTREEEAAEFAAMSLGRRTPRRSRRTTEWSVGDLLTGQNFPLRSGLVCPPGALGRLQPHQAYVVTADGNRTQEPLWLVPHFERVETVIPSPPPSPRFTATHVLTLMARSGLRLELSADEINRVLDHPHWKRHAALAKATAFFRARACRVPHGLETLPVPWLSGLPGILWSLREPDWTHVPYMINRMACVDGVLLLGFAQELDNDDSRKSSWDGHRVEVNERLAPNRWRSLTPRHRRLLLQPAGPAPGDAPALG